MHKVKITKPAKVPAEAIWQVLSDFGGFMNWARFSQGEIEVEGEGVGMIRHLKSAVGDIGEVDKVRARSFRFATLLTKRHSYSRVTYAPCKHMF